MPFRRPATPSAAALSARKCLPAKFTAYADLINLIRDRDKEAVERPFSDSSSTRGSGLEFDIFQHGYVRTLGRSHDGSRDGHRAVDECNGGARRGPRLAPTSSLCCTVLGLDLKHHAESRPAACRHGRCRRFRDGRALLHHGNGHAHGRAYCRIGAIITIHDNNTRMGPCCCTHLSIAAAVVLPYSRN